MRAHRVRNSSWLTASLVLGVMLSPAQRAAAWYFPEHAELTRLGLIDFAPVFASEAIERAMLQAAASDLQVCLDAGTKLLALTEDGDGVTCVPYGALPALAADNSRSASDLWNELSTPMWRPWPMKNRTRSSLVTRAALLKWRDFMANAPPSVAAIFADQLDRALAAAAPDESQGWRRDYVRTLDITFQTIDDRYASLAEHTKAHFGDPLLPLESLVARAIRGELDNALAQALAHHARSLQLAVRSRREVDPTARAHLQAEALLEHSFALHFMQDGLAAGHAVTAPSIENPELRKQRHDYFTRQGLAVTRSLARHRCEAEPPPPWSGGLPLCWIAHGDGFAMAEDRAYVGEATARLQTAFALALEPARFAALRAQLGSEECRSWREGLASSPSCDVARTVTLLDPLPGLHGLALLDVACNECDKGASETERRIRAWADRTLTRHERALEALASTALLRGAESDTGRDQPGVLSIEVVGRPFQVIAAALAEKDPRGAPDQTPQATPPSEADLGVLWIPLLAAWPASQADTRSLQGADSFRYGFKLQFLWSLGISHASPFNDDMVAIWPGGGTGIAFNAEGVLPRRRTRSAAELNIGFAQGIVLNRNVERFRSVGVLEARAPITTAALYGIATLWKTGVPIHYLGGNLLVGLHGLRLYFSLDDKVRLSGWDAEVLNLLLTNNDDAVPATSRGLLDMEGRLRIGFRSDDPDRIIGSVFGETFVIGFEITAGLFL